MRLINQNIVEHLVNNFWQPLREKSSPILGLSPMDGVTDAACRKIIAQTSQPDVIMTEFVNVEGLARGAVRMLDDFVYSSIERPIVAQIYGTEIESFYQVALMACYLGFDGIDINMGCPAKKVAHRGAGAGLIQDPEHAKKIIRRVKEAVEDFANGKTLREAGVREKIVLAIEKRMFGNPPLRGGLRGSSEAIVFEKKSLNDEENVGASIYHAQIIHRKKIPVSVKTRMGYDEIVAEHWMEHLLEEHPDAITLHGRTLKQGYKGEANWEVIAKAGEIIKKNRPETIFLGNGDITSRADALEKIATAGIDGALIGRATFGNPWIFLAEEFLPTEDDLKNIALEHCQVFEEVFPEKPFFIMKKHLAWYMKGFVGSKEMRNFLMRSGSFDEVRKILRGEMQKG